jgi:hypothetical protein
MAFFSVENSPFKKLSRKILAKFKNNDIPYLLPLKVIYKIYFALSRNFLSYQNKAVLKFYVIMSKKH